MQHQHLPLSALVSAAINIQVNMGGELDEEFVDPHSQKMQMSQIILRKPDILHNPRHWTLQLQQLYRVPY